MSSICAFEVKFSVINSHVPSREKSLRLLRKHSKIMIYLDRAPSGEHFDIK